MILVPAHRSFSVDARINPALRSSTVPAWALWLVRFQVGIAYFYAGIAKLNGDWLHGEPLRRWLLDAMDFPLIGRWFDEPAAAYLFSYGGLALDLSAVPLLLWRRTRPYIFAALVCFHVMNTQLFSIGIFPYLMLGATTIFFDPDWPRRALALARRGLGLDPATPPQQAAPAPVTAPPVPVGAGRSARSVRRLQRARAAAPPRLPGRGPLDRGGPPLRVAHEAARQGGRRRGLPRHSRPAVRSPRSRRWSSSARARR